MILKAKGNYGVMPVGVIKEYGISPVDGEENKKVWPVIERGAFMIIKDAKYNVIKEHPFFEGKVSSGKKVLHDDSPSSDSGQRA